MPQTCLLPYNKSLFVSACEFISTNSHLRSNNNFTFSIILSYFTKVLCKYKKNVYKMYWGTGSPPKAIHPFPA